MMLPRMPKLAQARRPHLVEDAICRHLTSFGEREYCLTYFLLFSVLILQFLESQGFS